MKFFIDTANLAQIKEANDLGILDGVTTNPSLMAKEGIKGEAAVMAHYKTICEMVDGDISAEVISTDFDGMIREGHELAKIAKNVTIKVPLTLDGLKACKVFTSEGTMVNVTLCFSATQALLAAKAGATFVSPFIGRLDDIGLNGMDLIREIRTIYDNYQDLQTDILAASIRTVGHVKDAAMIGADVATIPPAILKALVKHPLTDSGLATFIADWKKTGQKII